MDIKIWLQVAQLTLVHSNASKRDAEILLEFVMEKPKSWLKAFDDASIRSKELKRLNFFLNKRVQGYPIAYLIEEWEFWSLPLKITPITFIPRTDTETLVSQALLHITNASMRILDLGTGSGAIALAIAWERSDCYILGVDYNQLCVFLAQYNAWKLGIKNATFIYSNWFSTLSGKSFHIIVSNPPYIDRTDIHLKCGDLRFEPTKSLIAQNKGMGDLKKIIFQSSNYLEYEGWLLVEHGYQQGEQVRKFMIQNNFEHVRTYFDFYNNERVTSGQKLNRGNFYHN